MSDKRKKSRWKINVRKGLQEGYKKRRKVDSCEYTKNEQKP